MQIFVWYTCIQGVHCSLPMSCKDEVAIGFPTQESCSNDAQAEHEACHQSYSLQENNIQTLSCPAQRVLEGMNIRNSPEMIQKCIAAVQNLCDACVEVCKLQQNHTNAH